MTGILSVISQVNCWYLYVFYPILYKSYPKLIAEMVMGQQDKASLILPLIEHMLENEKDLNAWRKELTSAGAMTMEDAMGLGEAELMLAFRTMKAVQFQSLKPEDLLAEIESHHVSWKVDMSDDFQQGAICY